MSFIQRLKSLEKFRKKRIILVSFLIVFVVALVIFILITAANKSIYKERKSSLQDTTNASAMTVNTAIEGYKHTADIFVNMVDNNLHDYSSVYDFIADTKKEILSGNNMFFLVDSEGRYYSSDGKSGVLADLSYYASSTDDKIEYLSTLPHLDGNVTYLIMRERLDGPIRINTSGGTVKMKYCAIMFDLNELEETVSSLFAGANNTFIYESSTGSMLYKQFNIGLLIEGYNIYPKWSKSKFDFGESDSEMIEKCKNRETCVAQIEIDGVDYYACSAPLDIDDWSLMFIVQKKYIEDEADSGFNHIILIIITIICLLGAAFMSYIVIYILNRFKSDDDKNQQIINALSVDFESVMFVPFTRDKYEDKAIHYRKSEKLLKYIPEIEDESLFSSLLDIVCGYISDEKERKEFYSKTRREKIIDKLKKETAYYVPFKLKINGNDEYLELQFSSAFDKKGNNIGFVMDVRNVDAETKEKIAMQENLQKALTDARYASEAKTSFLFNMSHDIRTPMNAIIGFTNMAIRDIDSRDKTMDSLKKIQKSGDVLLNLVNDILEMSRIESGKVIINENKYDVAMSFENVIPVMNDLAASKDISIDYIIENIQNRYVYADTVRFQRILINLISNAVKYTNDGGWVKVKAQELKSDKEGYGLYRYTVADNGIGMSEEFQKHLFEEFTREETATTSGIQGTGLGLALVKSLTELMNGSVSVKSKLGIGSEFTVDIPFRIQSEEDIKRIKNAEAEKNDEELSLSGKRVLLVEDNELNREIATDILEEEGLTVYTAEDGSEAVDRLRKNGPEAYDFILMDIQMPVMDGYEAAKTIRNLWPDKNIIIIALSANAFEEDKRKSVEAGMNDHIAKPINVDELFKTIKKYL